LSSAKGRAKDGDRKRTRENRAHKKEPGGEVVQKEGVIGGKGGKGIVSCERMRRRDGEKLTYGREGGAGERSDGGGCWDVKKDLRKGRSDEGWGEREREE